MNKYVKAFIYIIIVFVFQEVIFRALFPIPEIENFNRVNYMQLGFSEKEIKGISNIKLRIESGPDNAQSVHDLNLYGFSDGDWKVDKPKDKKRIFFIGDSYVEGCMAGENETIPKGFEVAAKEDGKSYDIMNLGIMALSCREYLRLIVDAVPIFKPDYVYVVFYANDFNKPVMHYPKKSLAPVYSNFMVPRIVEIVRRVIEGKTVPFRWSLKTVDFYKKVPDVNNPWTENEDKMKGRVSDKIEEAMKQGKFNPYVLDDLYNKEKYLREERDFHRKIGFIKTFLNKHNSKLVVAFIPSRNQVTDYYLKFEKEFCVKWPDGVGLTDDVYKSQTRALEKSCKDLAVPFIDLTGYIEKEEQKGNHQYYDYDEHMKGETYLNLGVQLYRQSPSIP